MYVLGIETSCDETSASVVKDGKKVLSNVTASSLSFHQKYGGVVPEIAFRLQLETVTWVTDSAIKEAGVKLQDMNLVSVTSGPGLLGSLLVGISFAKAVSLSLDIPLLGINHLYSHIYASFLQPQMSQIKNPQISQIKYLRNLRLQSAASAVTPFVALVVSGGHTSLFYVEDFHKVKLLGVTLDDACGEAFDKVAKILGCGYPGGPIIEQLARGGDAKKITFRCSGTKRPLDFSFSGIKTAVLYATRNKHLGITAKRDLAASFQEAVIEALIKKSLLACKSKKTNRLVLGGGVVANNRLRERFSEEARKNSISVYLPSKELCMDNAAMVAGLGYQLFKKGVRSNLDLTAQLN